MAWGLYRDVTLLAENQMERNTEADVDIQRRVVVKWPNNDYK